MKAIGVFVLAGLLSLYSCASPAVDEIDQARAIELAKPEVSFEPDSIEAVRTTENGRPVWQITFRSGSGLPHLTKVMVVSVDRKTGEVVALARN
jgi:hypothetical protein